MSTETSAPIIKPTELFQDILGKFYSRRLLLHTAYQPPTTASPPLADAHEASHSYADHMSFDANVVMVLSLLLCALICSLGLHSIIRCALRYSNLLSPEASDELAVRLANTGVKQKALKSFQTVRYTAELKLPGLATECAICLSEFVYGERVKLLPKCHHGFHVRCIDKWLSSHSSCPTCRHCLIQTCQKIACSSEITSSPLLTKIELQLRSSPRRWRQQFSVVWNWLYSCSGPCHFGPVDKAHNGTRPHKIKRKFPHYSVLVTIKTKK